MHGESLWAGCLGQEYYHIVREINNLAKRLDVRKMESIKTTINAIYENIYETINENPCCQNK